MKMQSIITLEDAIQSFFDRFSKGQIEPFCLPLWRWVLELLETPKAGFSLDLDSTVFSHDGGQEVALEDSEVEPREGKDKFCFIL